MTATVSKMIVLAEPPLRLGFAFARDYGVLFQWQLVVLAQRLVRTLCPQCKQPYPIKASDRQLYGFPVGVTQLYKAVGCDVFHFTGYKERTGIYELLLIDETTREAIYNADSEQAIVRAIRRVFVVIFFADDDGRYLIGRNLARYARGLACLRLLH